MATPPTPSEGEGASAATATAGSRRTLGKKICVTFVIYYFYSFAQKCNRM